MIQMEPLKCIYFVSQRRPLKGLSRVQMSFAPNFSLNNYIMYKPECTVTNVAGANTRVYPVRTKVHWFAQKFARHDALSSHWASLCCCSSHKQSDLASPETKCIFSSFITSLFQNHLLSLVFYKNWKWRISDLKWQATSIAQSVHNHDEKEKVLLKINRAILLSCQLQDNNLASKTARPVCLTSCCAVGLTCYRCCLLLATSCCCCCCCYWCHCC